MATEGDEIINNNLNLSKNSNNSSNSKLNDPSIKNQNGNLNLMMKAQSAVAENGHRSSNENVSSNKHRGRRSPPNHYFNDLPDPRRNSHILVNQEDEDGLGALPPKWEKAYTENGEIYFIDHNSGTSHWLDPRLSKYQKKSLEDCLDDELPYGWEKIHDPQYGTYYIDHVNRRTQYENPVLEAKRHSERLTGREMPKIYFTKNPAELCGEKVTTTLLKSTRGLGFTIVGGDDNIDEFLQIKSIVPNGPAWLDGKLLMGDILVYVNDTCVLGFTHHEMVNIFQSIQPGETVVLEACRGYPLPFDPNDPNTEVVTTIAVDGLNNDPEKTRILMDLNMDGNYNFLDLSDPNGSGTTGGPSGVQQKGSQTKIPAGSVISDASDINELTRNHLDKPEMLSISIVKGALGFGFTIADSAHGQKVKKILDRNCCKNLLEGDILLTINSITVKHMSHSEVVQVLKDCPKTQEALLRIQRGPQYSTVNMAAKTANKLRKSAEAAKLTSNDLFRSKTPTADLYSTQTKEILPIRPKTPLVDTRNRAKTPSNEITNEDDSEDKNEKPMSESKSQNSLHDQDSITNDIPCMDPFPKFVTNLTERLAQTSLLQERHQNIYAEEVHQRNRSFGSSQPDLNYDPQMNPEYYGYNQAGQSYHQMHSPLPPLPIMAPVPTYHQDNCFCYECQDFNRQQQEYNMLQQQYYMHHSNGKSGAKKNIDYMLDRRKIGFSPVEVHSSSYAPQQQQQQYWKYEQASPGGHHEVNNGMSPGGQLHEEYTLSEVALERQALGFGFRIVGGTEEGSQVTVGHIVPGGSADRDPRIQSGDEILSIDGVNVVNASHHRVVQLMGEAGLRGQVRMILRRKNQFNQNFIRYPYDVIVSRNENEGFGFVIISSSNQYFGSTIGKLIVGSPADRCNELKIGDRIIAVNRMDIVGMTHGEVVNLIKESGFHVRLTIGHPREQPPVLINQNSQTIPNGNSSFDRYPVAPIPQL